MREAPRQQLVEAFDRVGAYAGEDIAQVGFGLEAVELGCADQRVEGGGALATRIRAGEQPDDMTFPTRISLGLLRRRSLITGENS